MPVDLSIVEGRYLRDILDQPEALKATLENLSATPLLRKIVERLHAGDFQRIVLTGMGSSLHVLHPLNLKLVAQGFNAFMAETSELIHYMNVLLDPTTLVVAVSQSGQSAEMIRLIELNADRAPIIAVTNTQDSPLAIRSKAAVLTAAGAESSVSCKTYTSALMALEFLGEALCGGDLSRTGDKLEQASAPVTAYLACWKKHVSELTDLLQGSRCMFLLGRGDSLAAAGCGALIIKESDHFFAEGMSSAAFRHGPFEMFGADTFVLIFSGDKKTSDLNSRLRTEIVENGGRAELVGARARFISLRIPDATPCIRPILEILPIHMITLALAALDGREPGRFTRASKVTTTE